jgi:hypothetical protein
MTELAVIMASGDISLINIGPNKAVDEGSLPILLDSGSILSIKQGAFQVVDEDSLNTLLAAGAIPNILFDSSQALNESNLPIVYPFGFEIKDQTTNPGWADVATTYPAVVGAPAPDQVELRLQDNVVAGVYIISTSTLYTLDEDKESAMGRFSFDNGLNWLDFSKEHKDKSDATTFAYNFPYTHAGGPLQMVWQMKREGVELGTLAIIAANMWYERKM